jgi:outer membrane protein
LREVKDNLVSTQDAHRWAAMQIYQDVASAFYTVLSLEHSRQIINDEIKQYDERIKEEKDFFDIGRARNSDVETVQADQALLEATGVQVDEMVAVEREVLAFLTGQDPALALEASDPVPADAGDMDALIKGLDQRPDIHAALMQEKAAEEFVGVNRGSHLPSVDLLAHWYPVERPASLAPIDWDAGISATLPLFEGFTLVSKDRQAESLQRTAQLNLDLQRRQAASALRTAWHTLDGDLAQLKADDQAFTLSYKAYTHLEQDYKQGLDTNQDVLIAMTASWVAKQALETMSFTARSDYEQLQTIAGNRLSLYPDDQDKQ